MTENTQNKDVKEEAQCAEGAEPCCCAKEGEAECACRKEEQAQEEKTPEQTLEDLQTALKLSEAKVLEHYDLYVRAMAELENTRRRASEEVQKARKFGIEKFAENLLPVVDSLEKALEVTKDKEGDPVREGMLAVYRQLIHALDVSQMKPIDPKGEVFDPHTQQAVAMVPAPEGAQPGTVVDVFQRGWMIAERVLRPAMVSVAQG
ncbi:MAG: nucleotide exchange factor GrpE [Sutterella sp.]|nr:nucleotide exchange factor GrpE [Sutterella sp.]